MALIVFCRLPFRTAAFPLSVGIETFINMRIDFLLGGGGKYTAFVCRAMHRERPSPIVPCNRSMLFLGQTLRKCNEQENRSNAHSCWHLPRKVKLSRVFALTTPIPEVLRCRSRSSASASAS